MQSNGTVTYTYRIPPFRDLIQFHYLYLQFLGLKWVALSITYSRQQKSYYIELRIAGNVFVMTINILFSMSKSIH